MRLFYIFSCLFICLFANFSPVWSQIPEANIENTVAIYEQVNPAIVAIEANIKNGQSFGSGFVIDEKGVILTSLHVVEDVENVDVTTSSGQVYSGEVICLKNADIDLALIKIKPKEKLSVLKLGDFDEIKVGQKIVAIGNPFGFKGTMTVGIVSRIDYAKNRIQTDAAINPGSSGGPLINTSCEVIGISQAIFNPDNNQSNIGIGFAVPVNDVKKFLALAKKEKKF